MKRCPWTKRNVRRSTWRLLLNCELSSLGNILFLYILLDNVPFVHFSFGCVTECIAYIIITKAMSLCSSQGWVQESLVLWKDVKPPTKACTSGLITDLLEVSAKLIWSFAQAKISGKSSPCTFTNDQSVWRGWICRQSLCCCHIFFSARPNIDILVFTSCFCSLWNVKYEWLGYLQSNPVLSTPLMAFMKDHPPPFGVMLMKIF